ncbi:hypothetical protein FJ957_11320 [Mesorhizobium sp. B2-4-6]|nr:hypothetical protein FJ957_11320 [Mesorhizobium sp. B2-4-6]
MTATATIEAVWRIEQPKLAAKLTRTLRDVGSARCCWRGLVTVMVERKRIGRRDSAPPACLSAGKFT